MITTILSLVLGLVSFAAIFFGLNWPIWMAGVIGIGVYFATSLLAQPRIKIGNTLIEDIANGAELRAMLDQGNRDIAEIDALGKRIGNDYIRQSAFDLAESGRKIVKFLSENPMRLSKHRRFFSYYLKTARNILDKFETVQQSDLQTVQVYDATKSTEKAMAILNEAFDRQFTRMMADDIMDIDADIKLLETDLKMEGFDL